MLIQEINERFSQVEKGQSLDWNRRMKIAKQSGDKDAIERLRDERLEKLRNKAKQKDNMTMAKKQKKLDKVPGTRRKFEPHVDLDKIEGY
tara:strand:- start:159 stop:428 length:270 start_codon:yes stop_codon:yes gene_type:complete